MDSEMQPFSLDMDTAERLLAGAIAAEDAPPGYAGVARLLEAVSAEPAAGELGREAAAVASIAAAVRSSSNSVSSPRRSVMPFTLKRARVAAAVVVAGLAGTAGLASAGSLPGAAQDVASTMLAKIGISVPGPNDHAGSHPGIRGSSATAPANAGKGSDISTLATRTTLTGVAKGSAISTAASNGKSQAGQHAPAAGVGSARAPVATPNSGGTGTADTASGGQSSQGTSTANTASGGDSSAGSGNASSGQATAGSVSGANSSAGSDNASSGQSHRP